MAATSVPAVKVTSPTSLEPKQPKKSNFKIPIFVSAAVIVILAAIFFFGRKHQASPTAKAPETAPKASSRLFRRPLSLRRVFLFPSNRLPRQFRLIYLYRLNLRLQKWCPIMHQPNPVTMQGSS